MTPAALFFSVVQVETGTLGCVTYADVDLKSCVLENIVPALRFSGGGENSVPNSRFLAAEKGNKIADQQPRRRQYEHWPSNGCLH